MQHYALINEEGNVMCAIKGSVKNINDFEAKVMEALNSELDCLDGSVKIEAIEGNKNYGFTYYISYTGNGEDDTTEETITLTPITVY